MKFRLIRTYQTTTREWNPDVSYPKLYDDFKDRISVSEKNEYIIDIVSLDEFLSIIRETCGSVVVETGSVLNDYMPTIEIYDTWRE